MEERDLPPQCLFSRNLIVESVSRWSGYMNVCWLSLMKKDKKGNAVPGIRKTFRFSRTGQWPVTERNNKMYPTWNYMQFWIEKLIKWTSKRPKLISGPLMMKKRKEKKERERENRCLATKTCLQAEPVWWLLCSCFGTLRVSRRQFAVYWSTE